MTPAPTLASPRIHQATSLNASLKTPEASHEPHGVIPYFHEPMISQKPFLDHFSVVPSFAILTHIIVMLSWWVASLPYALCGDAVNR